MNYFRCWQHLTLHFYFWHFKGQSCQEPRAGRGPSRTRETCHAAVSKPAAKPFTPRRLRHGLMCHPPRALPAWPCALLAQSATLHRLYSEPHTRTGTGMCLDDWPKQSLAVLVPWCPQARTAHRRPSKAWGLRCQGKVLHLWSQAPPCSNSYDGVSRFLY